MPLVSAVVKRAIAKYLENMVFLRLSIQNNGSSEAWFR